jgi:hypothetical protein
MAEITVTNWRRSRAFGFGWSSIPTAHGTEIETPKRPDYTGTVRQVQEAIREDRALAATVSGGAYTSQVWFYKGKRITATKFGDHWYDGLAFAYLDADDDKDITIRVVD